MAHEDRANHPARQVSRDDPDGWGAFEASIAHHPSHIQAQMRTKRINERADAKSRRRGDYDYEGTVRQHGYAVEQATYDARPSPSEYMDLEDDGDD